MTKFLKNHETSSRWKLASELSGLGIWEYSVDETSRFFSDEWFLMRGLTPTTNYDLVESIEDWFENVHPNDLASVKEMLGQFHDGTISTINHEYRERHKDGHYVWILARGRAIEWNSDGVPCRFLGTDTDISSVKDAQRATAVLRESELRTRVAVENAGLGVWDIDLVHQERVLSDGWRTMRGYPADSDYGDIRHKWREDIHPDDLHKLNGQQNAFMTDPDIGMVSIQYRQKRADGTWMYVLSRGNIVSRDENGTPLRAIGVDADITEIQEQGAMLGRISKTLELAVSASQMGVWESYAETGDAVWDERTCEIFGHDEPSGFVSPEKFKSFIHPDDVSIVEEECDAPARAKRDFGSSYRIIHPQKGVRHVKIEAIFNPSHALGARHVGIIFDETDRVEREAALTETNELFDGVLNHMEQGIALFQGSGLKSSHIVLSNDRFYELLELERPPEGTHMSFEEYEAHIDPFLQWPQNGFNSLAEVVAAADTGAGLNTLLRLPSGREISVTGIGHGDHARIVTFTDMTALFKSERRREELADNVSHLERLQALGKLTGGVAHDFNNLLTVIIGNAELIQEGYGDHEECLSAILKASNRGANLTQRLLAFARKQPLQPISIQTDTLLINMQDLLTRTLGDTIEVNVAFDPEIWSVRADLGQLENALINLAVNARDAMPAGGTFTIAAKNRQIDAIEARKFEELQPGDYVNFTITDQGIGMDDQTLDKAFDPFFTTKDVGQGSGLGLSMVFGFIKQSNGEVSITSHPGQGTEVDFLLPRGENVLKQKPAEHASVAQVGQKQTILLVEDDNNVRRLAISALERLNYNVVAFNDAMQATEALTQTDLAPDLVISDVSLPGGMSGFDFGEHCAKMRPNTKILYMSGYSEDLLPAHRFDLDTLEFLKKPFTIQEFSARISAILGSV